MKTKSEHISLLKKISQKQLLFGLIIISFSLIVLYVFTRYYIQSGTEESLQSSSYRIEQLLKDYQNITSLKPLYEVVEVNELKPQVIKDTLIYDNSQDEMELFKELNSYKNIHGKNYRITVRNLIVESDDTLVSILISFVIIITLLFSAQYYYNKAINKAVWKPFFNNLKTIKNFSVQSNQSIVLESSDVLEFFELNQELYDLTKKVTLDYQNLKQFTENLSHEVQTPLAIIQAKIENLIDDQEPYNSDKIQYLNDIQKNVKRLSKLNKGLILLTKIDNQQFDTLDTINVGELIRTQIEEVEDVLSIKEQHIIFLETNPKTLLMDKTLGAILFSNLIKNAVKYTPNNGKINIELKSNQIKYSNTGTKAITNSKAIFQRFYKEDSNTSSLGLGLAIVNKICDFYNFTISYSFYENEHHFCINFD